MSQTITWTLLPNGVDTGRGRARLSAVAGMRLVGNQRATLADFPVQVWPEVPWQFVVVASGVGGEHELPVTVVSPPPDPALWVAAFPSTLPVERHRPSDLPTRLVRSAPVANLRGVVRQSWASTLLTSPDAVPSAGFGIATQIPPAFFDRTLAALEEQLTATRAIPVQDPADPGYSALVDVVEHRRFFQRTPYHPGPLTSSTPAIPKTETPALDVHRALAAAGQHPALLRRLGLVVDLEVDLAGIVAAAGAPIGTATVRLLVDSPILGPDTTMVLPRTRCAVAPSGFVTSWEPGGEVVAGAVPLDDPGRHEVVEVDVDGAMFKLESLRSGAGAGPGDERPLPALRSVGLSLHRRGRATALAAKFTRAGALEAALLAGQDVTLTADDVTRGLRVHVWDGERWHSLLRRIGTYEVGAGGAIQRFEATDEGWVSTTPAGEAGPNATSDLYLPEAIFTWSGWSLAAPRPGTVIQQDHSLARTNEEVEQANVPITARFRAEPGTLPILRYGRDYRFRLLAVDLAGNSVDPGDPRDLGGSGPPSEAVRFRRFEAIEPPVLLLRRPRTEGEAVDRVVIRSDYNLPDGEVDPVERHLAPPRVSQLMAEMHGLFDGPDDRPDPAAYAAIGARDAFDLENSPQAVVEATRPGDDPTQRSHYYDVDELDISYLLDPLAIGVLFEDLPNGATTTSREVLFTDGAPWPDRRAIRLRVRQGTGAPDVVTEGGVPILVVQVPRGERRTISYRSFIEPSESFLELHGIPPLVLERVEGANAATREAATRAILESRSWMVTPARSITLVNASKRPTLAPQVRNLGLDRVPGGDPALVGSTRATFSLDLGLHRPSTAKVEMTARWDALVDVGVPLDDLPDGVVPTADPDPSVPIRFATTAYGVPLDPPRVPGQPDPAPDPNPNSIARTGLVHELGDTKHHRIDYQALATSSATEYFVQRRVVSVATPGTVVVDPAGFVPGQVRVTTTDRSVEFRIGPAGAPDTDVSVDPVAGTIATSRLLRLPTGPGGLPFPVFEVEVAYVTPEVSLTGADLFVHVASTAAPPAPLVRAVLPTFKWSSGGDGVLTRTSSRNGRGVRVWLDRPWYSSGEDEMLGVVLPGTAPLGAPSSIGIASALEPYVTQYGDDPVSASASTRASRAAPSDFPRRDPLSRDDVMLREVGLPVRVAAHRVAFDRDRALWYSDIELDGVGGYFPFVRLALARFQPYSLDGLELSPVVLADFVQLAPDRTVTVVADLTSPNRVTVTVNGPTLSALRRSDGQRQTTTSKVRVWVERQDIVGAGDLSWAAPSGATPQQLPALANPLSTSTTWRGTVNLLANRFTTPQRLVIEEYEERDAGVRTDGADGRRITYTDIVRL